MTSECDEVKSDTASSIIEQREVTAPAHLLQESDVTRI